VDSCRCGNEPPSSINAGNVACFLPGRAKDLSAPPVLLSPHLSHGHVKHSTPCTSISSFVTRPCKAHTATVVKKVTSAVSNLLLCYYTGRSFIQSILQHSFHSMSRPPQAVRPRKLLCSARR